MKKYNCNDVPNSTTHEKISLHQKGSTFFSQEFGMTQKSFYIKTFGCQMNVADSGRLSELMEAKGYQRCDEPDSAHLVFINTCTVRQHAEDKAISYIGRFRKWKDSHQERKIIVMGCVVERMKENLRKKYPFIDFLISSKEVPKLDEILQEILKDSYGDTGEEYLAKERLLPTTLKLRRTRRRYAPRNDRKIGWVTIMRGCNNNCSYCIVPHVRGSEIYRSSDEIISVVRNRIVSGVSDITLLGQNVNSYKNGISFAELLDRVASIPGLKSLSFITSHPKDLGDDTIDIIAKHPHIPRILHLPVQSGSDNILALMNRGYTKETYLNLIAKIKSRIPGIQITTDVIVGYPGEKEEDFNETVDLIFRADFFSSYAFKYSSRAGTPASTLPDSVPREVKERRLQEILKILKEKAHARSAA